MPVRKVITHSGRQFRGRYPSLKCGRMVSYESLLERDVILLLEFSAAVVSYEEQPELVFYSDDQGTKKYFPDFEVVLTSGAKVHVEAKPAERLVIPHLAKVYRAVASHYSRFRDERFLIVTDREARAEPLHSNLMTLSAIRAKSEVVAPFPQTVFQLCRPTVWEALEAEMGRPQLLRYLALGHLSCDLRCPLEGALPVFPKGEARDSLFI